jgi:hypothetical protein
MKYYSINTYNYENLSPEDKRFIDGIQYAISVVEDKKNIFDDFGLTHEEDILSRIKKEVISDAIEVIAERLRNVQSSVIVDLIDQYHEKD